MKYILNKEHTNQTHFAVWCSLRGEAFQLETDWQGCSNLFINSAALHICEMDEFLQALKEMKDLALEYFDGEFCVGVLTPEMVESKIAEYTTKTN